MNMLDKLRLFKIGDKVTLYKLNIYNEPFPIKGILCDDEFKQSGYYNKDGGWSFCKLYDDEEECYEVLIRPYKKRSVYKFKTGFEIIDIKSGWIDI